MKENIDYYLLGRKYSAHPIFCKDVVCEHCEHKINIEYEAGQSEITKTCPNCKKEIKIILKAE